MISFLYEYLLCVFKYTEIDARWKYSTCLCNIFPNICCGRDVTLFQMSPECKHPLGAFLGGEKKCLGRIILILFSTRCVFGSYCPSHCTQSMFSYPPLCQVFLRVLIHFPIFSLLSLGPSFWAVTSYRNSFIIQQAFIEHLIYVKPKVKKTDMIVCLMELIVWSELCFLVHR